MSLATPVSPTATAPVTATAAPPSANGNTETATARLMSLDALRGFDMFWIVGATGISGALLEMAPSPLTTFVATQLEHVQWQGFHFYDFIFPLFLFIVGVSIALSLGRYTGGADRKGVVGRILRRSILLYLLGVFYHGGLSEKWPAIQFSGVLQRIAACYLAASLLFLYCRVRTLVVVAIALLVGYWGAVTFIPFPDLKLDPPTVDRLAAQAGSQSPSAIAALVPQRVSGVYDEGRNLTNYLDFRFLPGRKPIGRYYINEGLLSTFPAISISLAGIFAALLLRSRTLDERRKTGWLFAAGVMAVAVALLWSLQFPLIKRMWSSSFCLLTIGCGAMVFAVFYLVIDVWQMRRWCQPFVWIGSNAITIYLASSLFHFGRIADRLVGGDVKAFLNAHVAKGFGSLVSALVGLALVVWLMRFLYQRKIFLRV